MKTAWVVVAIGLLCFSMQALADDKCPASVQSAVERTFPGSEVKKCEIETEKGKQVYEVKLKTKDGHVSKMNIDPAGLVLMTSQFVATDTVPVVVMKNFQGKYANYKVVRTEKVTFPDGKTTYRVIYAKDNSSKKAVVYTPEGTVVEEIETYNDDADTD
jgi:uncharacterized protein YpmB